MSRKNRTPEENARRAKIRELLHEASITSMADIQNLFRETIAEFMENGLEAQDNTAPGNWVHFSFGWVQNAQSKTGGDSAGKNVIYFARFY